MPCIGEPLTFIWWASSRFFTFEYRFIHEEVSFDNIFHYCDTLWIPSHISHVSQTSARASGSGRTCSPKFHRSTGCSFWHAVNLSVGIISDEAPQPVYIQAIQRQLLYLVHFSIIHVGHYRVSCALRAEHLWLDPATYLPGCVCRIDLWARQGPVYGPHPIQRRFSAWTDLGFKDRKEHRLQ